MIKKVLIALYYKIVASCFVTRNSLCLRASVANSCCLFAALCLCASVAFPQTLTQISDTLKNADGTTASGQIFISWDPFTAASGETMDGGTKTYTIPATGVNAGKVDVSLAPNVGATPAGTSYRARYFLANGASYEETWAVPATGPVPISAIRTLPTPTPVSTYLTMLNTLTAATQTFSRVNDSNVTLAITSSGGDHQFALGWSGALALARGGTSRSASWTASRCVRVNDAGTALEPATADCGSGGGGGGGHTIQEEGAALPQRGSLNFIGPAITAADDSANDRTNVTVVIDDSTVPNNLTLDNLTQITTRNYSALQNRGHDLTGADHTASGLTAGQVVRATGAATFAFQAIQDGDLPSSLARDSEINVQGTAGQITSSGSGVAPALAIANPFTFPGKATFAASATGAASANVPSGTAPSSPSAGDWWNESGVLKFRDATTTQSLLFQSRAVNTNSPLGGGGALTGDLTLTCATCEVTANKNAANGYAGLDGGSRIAKAQAPSTTAYTDAGNTYYGTTTQDFGVATITLVVPKKTDPGSPTTGELWINSASLKYRDNQGTPATQTLEIQSNKNAASGYAGLTASTKLTASQGQEVWGLADLTDVSATTGSGTIAVLSSSPTLTTPRITEVKDGNGNVFLVSSATASAVDSITVTNTATANPATVALGASGTDSNINLNLTSKGTGTVQANGSTVATLVASGTAGSGPSKVGTASTAARSDHDHRSIHSLTWFFPGTPGTGVQNLTLVFPESAVNISILDLRATVNTTSASSSTFNIQRCTANCTGTSPTFANIYSTNLTLNANTRTVAKAAAPDQNVSSLAGGDQFKANLNGIGSGLADVTLTMTYKYDTTN